MHIHLTSLVGGDIHSDDLGAALRQLVDRPGQSVGVGSGNRSDLVEGHRGTLAVEKEVEDPPVGGPGVQDGAPDDRGPQHLQGVRTTGVGPQSDSQRGELPVDLGQCPLGVEIAGGSHHLGEHGVLAELNPVDHGDVEVRRRIEQAYFDARGQSHPVVLPGFRTEEGLVDLDARQAEALEPGQRDRVAFDDLQQSAQDGLLYVGMRRGTGGHGVREELGLGVDRKTQVHQVGGNEDFPTARQRPGTLPSDGQPGVVTDQGGIIGGELALRAPGKAARAHGVSAEISLCRHDEIGVVPRARRVPLKGLGDGDVPGADRVDGPSGAVEISLYTGVTPIALGM